MFSRLDIIYALHYLIRLVNLLILVRVLMTWINPSPRNPIVQFIFTVTEPVLSPIRHLIYNVFGYSGMLDFSPILAIFVLNFLFYNVLLRFL
ncbi:YggT family protein [Alkaliphilus peptidifermentans]|uniref:YggT family protein n=1 Tax=Alkaliphilus peptidifermentans DSM 18978 TaxID=1120976 RepID=A0A1G5BA54_9FIRM|nr:YggT family protein [Alkaliphilus peptidifermentans DSM 18978]